MLPRRPLLHPLHSVALGVERHAWTVLLVLHLGATLLFFPPSELLSDKPIMGADHPFHAYDAHLYREALRSGDWPWGYDPALSAGKVLRPNQDSGGRPQEVLTALLPFLSPGTVVRWFLFVGVLLFPLGTLLATRCLGLAQGARVWSLATLLSLGWLYPAFLGFFKWGMVAFASAAYLSPFALALFGRYLERPHWRRYWGLLGLLSLMLLFHVLGLVVIAPALLLYAILARPLAWRWRLPAFAAPLGAGLVNAFWLVPLALALTMPDPPGRAFAWNPPDLNYLNLDQLLAVLSPLRVAVSCAGLAVGVYGFVLLARHSGRRTAGLFAVAGLTGLLLKFGGSFVPGVFLMQPSRFILPAVAVMTIPAGLTLFRLCTALRVPSGFGAVAFAIAITVLASIMPQREGSVEHVNYAGKTERHGGSFVLRLPTSEILAVERDALLRFIREQTSPDDRLLIQTMIQCEPLVFPMLTGREVVSNTYLDLHDPAQFLRHTLLGRSLDEWRPEDLRVTLDRWGISYAIAGTATAIQLLTKTTGHPGQPAGTYRAFRVGPPSSRFLVGDGLASARINRIELSDLRPRGGMVVLRYRYHPAWKAEPPVAITPYPIPEDPSGFIALIEPPQRVTLRFEPWRMLRAEWPVQPERRDVP